VKALVGKEIGSIKWEMSRSSDDNIGETAEKVAVISVLSQMTTRSNTPASMKRWDKSGYVTVLTGYPMAKRH
jgi:hypothetical protein